MRLFLMGPFLTIYDGMNEENALNDTFVLMC